MAEAEKTKDMINENRENYRPVAKRGSQLYFVIADLSGIDPMYQYSLEFFARLFNRRLEKSQKSENLEERIQIVLKDETTSFYTNICRGLFEKDKLLYSFLNAVAILRGDGRISLIEWNFYLRGSTTDFSDKENKTNYLSDAQWYRVLGLEEAHAAFRGLAQSFADIGDGVAWKKLLLDEDPSRIRLPALFEDGLTPFQKLMIIRAIREEKTVQGVKAFVAKELGPAYIESPPFDLEGAAGDSTAATPIIFVLSPGADPIADLIALAKSRGVDNRLKVLSLGQGQGVIAQRLIENG